MKGKLYNQNGEWFVEYKSEQAGENIWVNRLPLHPDDVKQIEEDSKVFDNIEARIAANPNVIFIIKAECCTPKDKIKKYINCVGCNKKVFYAKLKK
jgi:hypothetical protein